MSKKLFENYFIKNLLILLLSLSLILFTQWVKVLKYGDKGPQITTYTFLGLLCLGLFAIIGIILQRVMQKAPIKLSLIHI